MPGPYVRVFWTVQGKVDKDGHPIEYPTEAAARAQASGGGIAGTGIGAGLGPVPAATPPVKVTESMTEDGEYVQTVDGPDGQPQEVNRGVDKARLDLYKARQATQPGAQVEYRTGPNGELLKIDKQTGAVTVEMTKPQGPVTPEAPTLHTLPSGDQASWNPATGTWDVQFTKPPAAPSLDLGPPRPGQRTNLALVEQQYKLFAQQLAATPGITAEEYNRRLQSYIATYVTPAVQQATDEVNAEADRKRREEEAATRRAEGREQRLTTTAEAAEARQYAEFQQTAGQNAVSNALALMPYQANPQFLRELSAGLGVLSGGGGRVSFSPEAFQVPLPDLDALAERGAQRAAALYRSAGGVPFTPRPAAGAVAQPTAADAALATSAFVPPPRPSMPGAPTAPVPTPQAVPVPWEPFPHSGTGAPAAY